MMEKFFDSIIPYLPYGVFDSWEDLNPRLYLSLHEYWLNLFGFWLITDLKTSTVHWKYIKRYLVVLLIFIIPWIGEIVYLMRKSNGIATIADGLYLLLSEICVGLKVFALWLNRDGLKTLIKYLHCEQFKPKEEEHRNIIRKTIKSARFVMTFMGSLLVMAAVVGTLMPMTEQFAFLPTNVEYPYVDVNISPVYQIIFLQQTFYKPVACVVLGVMDTILAALICVAIGQIEILSFNLRNFDMIAVKVGSSKLYTAKNNELSQYMSLRNCIKHHQTIEEFVNVVKSTFSLASILQLGLSGIVLCLFGIQLLSIENPADHPMQVVWMANYLINLLLELFILCWFGDQLMWKSQELRQAAFDSPWIDKDKKVKRIILILMERCKLPMTIDAGKLFVLSLDTFTVLINWAYKGFAVMRNMMVN